MAGLSDAKIANMLDSLACISNYFVVFICHSYFFQFCLYLSIFPVTTYFQMKPKGKIFTRELSLKRNLQSLFH